MGLRFTNGVGLAAGMDKNGTHIDALSALGFGHIEVGTVTPRPQTGNPRPRLFRLEAEQAIINRMGFNNDGVDALLNNMRRSNYQQDGGILGVNIGKNADTDIKLAADDYLYCLRSVYLLADYVTVNISSPNTQNLRALQHGAVLESLLTQLKTAQASLTDQHGRYVPLALKIAPDLDDAQIVAISDALRRHRLDAVIATNTTLARDKPLSSPYAGEIGGLSGAPLFERSTAVLRKLATALQKEVPVIGAGGIVSAHEANAKIEAGASLLQLYSGLIFRGPKLISEAAEACVGKL